MKHDDPFDTPLGAFKMVAGVVGGLGVGMAVFVSAIALAGYLLQLIGAVNP